MMWLSCFFFFKQKTAYEMRISDWSSDVCSSDLPCAAKVPPASWRTETRRMRLRRWRSASRTGRKLSPGTVKAVSTPASTSASTKAAPAAMTELSSGDPCGRRCAGKCRRAATKDGATARTTVAEELLRQSGQGGDGQGAERKRAGAGK